MIQKIKKQQGLNHKIMIILKVFYMILKNLAKIKIQKVYFKIVIKVSKMIIIIYNNLHKKELFLMIQLILIHKIILMIKLIFK